MEAPSGAGASHWTFTTAPLGSGENSHPEKGGSLAGIRTPILCSRGRCPTVERRGCNEILNHFAATAKLPALAGARARYENRVRICGSGARSCPCPAAELCQELSQELCQELCQLKPTTPRWRVVPLRPSSALSSSWTCRRNCCRRSGKKNGWCEI